MGDREKLAVKTVPLDEDLAGMTEKFTVDQLYLMGLYRLLTQVTKEEGEDGEEDHVCGAIYTRIAFENLMRHDQRVRNVLEMVIAHTCNEKGNLKVNDYIKDIMMHMVRDFKKEDAEEKVVEEEKDEDCSECGQVIPDVPVAAEPLLEKPVE